MAYDASNVAPADMYNLPEEGGFTSVNPEELMLSLRTKELKAANATIESLQRQNAQLKQELTDVYATLVTDKLNPEN